MRWLKTDSKILIGIDISAHYIKLVELERLGQTFQLIQYAITELPMMVLTENNEIKDSATIGATLSQLQIQYPLKTNKVAISMPGSSVVTKKVTLVDVPEKNIEARARDEACKSFPELTNDLSLDFCMLQPADKHHETSILLVACRLSSLQKRLDILTGSHLHPEVVDVDYYALGRALQYIIKNQADLDPNHTYALLNFTSHASTLVVVKNNQLIYSHEQVFDSQKLLQTLKHRLQWPAILSMRENSYAELDGDSMPVVLDTLMPHISHALELFYSSNQYAGINQLFLAGDCAIIPKLDELVTSNIGIAASIANPILNMTLAPSVSNDNLRVVAPALTLCCGLALHEGYK